MGSSKVIIKQQDRSAIVPALDGIEIGTVVNSKWGPLEPRLVTSPMQLLENYSTPDNSKGSSWNGAELLLANSNKVWITRAIHADAKHSASLVRFKIDEVDFNGFPAPTAMPDLVVKPVDQGITIGELESYSFPLYARNREYVNTELTVLNTYSNKKEIEISGFQFTGGVLSNNDVISFGSTANDSSAIYSISKAELVQVTEDLVRTDAALSGNTGTEVKKMVSNVATSYTPQIFLTDNVVTANELKVTNSDLIVNGDIITLNNGTTVSAVTEKTLVSRDAYKLTLDSAVSVTDGTQIQFMREGVVEHRDAFLVAAKYPGDLGDAIKVGVRLSTNYEEAFWLDVYFKGILEESFEVTRVQFLDGFGNQMFIEDKINGISKYILVKDNVLDEEKSLPLVTKNGVWRQDPTDLFNASTVTTVENVLKGDLVITVSSATSLSAGTRFKFGSSGLSEYKVLSKSGNNVTIDRPVVEESVALGTAFYVFDSTLENHSAGVYAGTQYYKFVSISPVQNYKIGDSYSIGNSTGKILDAGYNNCNDGSDGSNITLYDVIIAFNKMRNKEKYKISVFCDNGFAYPEVAIAIDEICKNTNLSHGYLSSSYQSEIADDYTTSIKNYRSSTNLNTEYASIFSGWIKVTDVYNQTKVWVAPSVFGVNAQSFVTRNYYMFTPAAGWVYGRLNGLEVTQHFTEGERDVLVDSQINPIRYREGWGLAIWGNETLYVKPSPLQLRSVAMLLIILKYGLENYLEFELFGMNNEPTWTKVESAIDTFIRDTLYIPGGLYAYQVSVKDFITDTDINNRKMPVFVGIQPTMDIKQIPVTLGIFNKSVEISF